MRRHTFTIAIFILVGAVCWGPSMAQDARQKEETAAAKAERSHATNDTSSTSGTPSTSSTSTTSSTTTATDKERQRKENELKEYKARLEVERRKRLEDQRGRFHPGIGYDDTFDRDYGYGYNRESKSDYGYAREGTSSGASRSFMPKGFSAGVVFAPGNGDRKPAVGVQFFGSRGWGAGVWLSGDMTRDADTVDTMIPHSDYYNEDSQGSYGFQALYSTGSESAMLITGVGFVVDRTFHTAVSNVTGWKWNAGSDSETKFAAQLGLRMRLGGRVSMQLGYDTVQNAFFGLTGDF